MQIMWAIKGIDINHFSAFYVELFLVLKSSMAFLIASSASIEQWSLTGGSLRYLAISVFLMFAASSMFIPWINSVAYELEAMALPQPNVYIRAISTLNTAFSMVLPSSLT